MLTDAISEGFHGSNNNSTEDQFDLWLCFDCILKANKLDIWVWDQKEQSKCCLNDQALIAWFTSTRGVCPVSCLADSHLYSGLKRKSANLS